MSVAMRMQLVADGLGGHRHEMRPAPPEEASGRKKKRRVPDPIEASAESAAQQLKLLIERIERINDEIASLQDDRKDVIAEAKANGYDTKALNTIIKIRGLDPHNRQEAEAILETYKTALGIA